MNKAKGRDSEELTRPLPRRSKGETFRTDSHDASTGGNSEVKNPEDHDFNPDHLVAVEEDQWDEECRDYASLVAEQNETYREITS